jgi:L-iditol 2-dehydrogenase
MCASEAWVCGAGSILEPREVAPARVEPDDLVLRMTLSGICGTDVVKVRGDRHQGQVLGHELVGLVERGPDELVGQRVVVAHHLGCGACRWCALDLEPTCASYRENLLDPGGFATTLAVRRRAVDGGALRVVPDDLSDQAAIFFEPLACAVRGLRRGGLLSARNVARRTAILGAGGTGQLLLLATRALDPDGEVVVVEPLGDRRALAERLGATATIEGAQGLDPTFDLVLDAAGATTAVAVAPGLLGPGGTLVEFAHARTGTEIRADHHGLFAGERRVLGSYSSGAADRDLAWELLTSRRVAPEAIIDLTVPFDEADRAMALSLEGQVVKAAIAGVGRGRREEGEVDFGEVGSAGGST